jgi:hypothetical protein
MRYVRKTNRPEFGTKIAAIREAGANGQPFTCLDVIGPWGRRLVQVQLGELSRQGRLEVVKPAAKGRYGSPTIYRMN